jgi:hypothetical protein
VFQNGSGWFTTEILGEAVANYGLDVTGYRLKTSEFVNDFGVGSAMSRLKTAVISQIPTITITFTQADQSAFASAFKKNSNAELSLFDIFEIGDGTASYQVTNVDTSGEAGEVILTFGPPTPSGVAPLAQSTAFLMGGVPSYPPGNP